jgi:hypothetical protein
MGGDFVHDQFDGWAHVPGDQMTTGPNDVVDD